MRCARRFFYIAGVKVDFVKTPVFVVLNDDLFRVVSSFPRDGQIHVKSLPDEFVCEIAGVRFRQVKGQLFGRSGRRFRFLELDSDQRAALISLSEDKRLRRFNFLDGKHFLSRDRVVHNRIDSALSTETFLEILDNPEEEKDKFLHVPYDVDKYVYYTVASNCHISPAVVDKLLDCPERYRHDVSAGLCYSFKSVSFSSEQLRKFADLSESQDAWRLIVEHPSASEDLVLDLLSRSNVNSNVWSHCSRSPYVSERVINFMLDAVSPKLVEPGGIWTFVASNVACSAETFDRLFEGSYNLFTLRALASNPACPEHIVAACIERIVEIDGVESLHFGTILQRSASSFVVDKIFELNSESSLLDDSSSVLQSRLRKALGGGHGSAEFLRVVAAARPDLFAQHGLHSRNCPSDVLADFAFSYGDHAACAVAVHNNTSKEVLWALAAGSSKVRSKVLSVKVDKDIADRALSKPFDVNQAVRILLTCTPDVARRVIDGVSEFDKSSVFDRLVPSVPSFLVEEAIAAFSDDARYSSLADLACSHSVSFSQRQELLKFCDASLVFKPAIKQQLFEMFSDQDVELIYGLAPSFEGSIADLLAMVDVID